MQYIQLFAELQGGTGGYGSYRELDLYAEEPIKFSRSIQAVEEPQAVTSDFSRTFRVPATSVNGQYFKAAFNVNSTDYDPTLKANAYINIDGAYFTSGNIRLTGIFRNDRTGKIEYEIVFMGETSNFASIVAPKNMSEINLSSLGHEYSIANVFLSWEAAPGSLGGLKNGDVLYPLCEWGYTYSSDGVPNENTLSVWTGTTGPGGSTKGFTNGNFPLSITQFKPAVRAKKIWDTIFEEAGYTYESQFLDSMFFQNIYMISTDQSTSYSTVVNIAKTDVGMLRTGVPSLPLNQYALINKYTEFFDGNNAFDPVRGIYVVPTTGSYTIEAEITLDYRPSGASPGTGYKNFVFALFRNGVVSITNNGFVPSQNNVGFHSVKAFSQITPTTSYVFNFSGSYTEGEILDFRLFLPQYYFTEASIYSGTITFNGPSRMVPTGLMPSQYKQIDFIKGINDRFKLMWEPDPENPKKFRIEPWVEWIRSGRQIDWSDKLDESKDLKIEPLFYTQSREIIFKDSEEADIYNFSYQQNNKQVFGQLDQDSGIELITGTKTLSNFFAPMPLAPLGNSQKFLVPHFAKVQSDQRQPIQVKPRLVFYNGMQPAPYNWYIEGNGIPFIQTKYPLVSQFSSYPFDNNAFDLNWTNVPQFWNPADNTSSGITGGTAMSGRTALTAYTNYWSEWFTETYNPYSRIMEGYFVLSNSDIQNLRFNDVIFIKDSWWFPVKLTDYSLGAKQSVKVQLIKLASLPLQITQTITTSTTTTTTTLPLCSTLINTTGTNIGRSPDGIQYQSISYPNFGGGWNKMYSPELDRWVIIGSNLLGKAVIIYSNDDGLSWQQTNAISAPGPTSAFNSTSNNQMGDWSPTLSLFCAPAGQIFSPPSWGTITSSDGINWTFNPTDMTNVQQLQWIPELNKFVALSYKFIGGVVYTYSFTSTNGVNWYESGNLGPNSYSVRMVWSPSLKKICVVGSVFDTSIGRTWISYDGIDWILSANLIAMGNLNPFDPNFYGSITWSETKQKFVICSKSLVDTVYVSDDGSNWIPTAMPDSRTYGLPATRWSQIEYIDAYGFWVAYLENTTQKVYVRSTDFINWTQGTGPGGSLASLPFFKASKRICPTTTTTTTSSTTTTTTVPTTTTTSTTTTTTTMFSCNNCNNWEYNGATIPVGGDVITYYRCSDGALQTIALSQGDPTGQFCNCDSVANPSTANGTTLTQIGICATTTTTTTTTSTTTTTTTAPPPAYNYYEFTPCVGGSPLLYRSTLALALFDVYTFAPYPPDRACYTITSITATPNTNNLPFLYGPLTDCNDPNCIQV